MEPGPSAQSNEEEVTYDPWRVYPEDFESEVGTTTAYTQSELDEAESSASRRSSESGISQTASTTPLTDEMRAEMVREAFGRGLNTRCDLYQLPADREEWDRLQTQHRLLINLTGKKYPERMVQVLTREPWQAKRVIDLGCGDGSWIKDVAKDFPNTLCVAVDLVPMEDTDDMPDNVRIYFTRSEVDDINEGLDHFYNQFDVVHARLISTGIKNYYKLIQDIARMVRPGGVIELVESDLLIYDSNHQPIHINTKQPPGPPYLATFMTHVYEALVTSGGDIYAADNLRRWVERHPAFEDVSYSETWLQCVGPMGGEGKEEAEAAMRHNMREFVRSGVALLLRAGVPRHTYDLLEAYTHQEIDVGTIIQSTRMQSVVATRNSIKIMELDSMMNVDV